MYFFYTIPNLKARFESVAVVLLVLWITTAKSVTNI